MARSQLIQTPLDHLRRRMLRARSRRGVIRAILSTAREQWLVDIANWRRDAWQRRSFPPESISKMQMLRDDLRELWSPQTSRARWQSILEKWRKVHGGFAELAERLRQLDLRQQLIHAVLAEQHRFAICANYPKCQRPYFLRRKRTQRYCSDICARSQEREDKKRWWANEGSRWRKRWIKTSDAPSAKARRHKQKKRRIRVQAE